MTGVASVVTFEYGNGPSQAVITTRSTPDSGLGADDRVSAAQDRQRHGYNASNVGGSTDEYDISHSRAPTSQSGQFPSTQPISQQHPPHSDGSSSYPGPGGGFTPAANRQQAMFYGNGPHQIQNMPSLVRGPQIQIPSNHLAGSSHAPQMPYINMPYDHQHNHFAGNMANMNRNVQPPSNGNVYDPDLNGQYFNQQPPLGYVQAGGPGPAQYQPQVMIPPGAQFPQGIFPPPNAQQYMMVTGQHSGFPPIMANGQPVYMGVPPTPMMVPHDQPMQMPPPVYRIPVQGPATSEQGNGQYSSMQMVVPPSVPFNHPAFSHDGRGLPRLSTTHISSPGAAFEARAFIQSSPRNGSVRRGRFPNYYSPNPMNYDTRNKFLYSRNFEARNMRPEELATRMENFKISNDGVPQTQIPVGHENRGRMPKTTGKIMLELANRAPKSTSPPQEPVPPLVLEDVPATVNEVGSEHETIVDDPDCSRLASSPIANTKPAIEEASNREATSEGTEDPAPVQRQNMLASEPQPLLKECSYCKGTKNLSVSEYTGHVFRGADKKVECPRAREELFCDICGVIGGDFAHSRVFCPRKSEGGHDHGHESDSSRSTSRSTQVRGDVAYRSNDRRRQHHPRGGRGGSFRGNRGGHRH